VRHAVVGGNYRMDALQAAILNVKLTRLSGYLELRTRHREAYDRELRDLSGLVAPSRVDGSTPSHSVYTVRVRDGRRDELAKGLAAAGIDTAVHYPVPLHRQPVLLDRAIGLPAGSLPVVESAAKEVLALPLFPELTAEDRQRVSGEVRRCLSH
jgi:dTDP-4-amino-4,6-dideoxygalactose transaminase